MSLPILSIVCRLDCPLAAACPSLLGTGTHAHLVGRDQPCGGGLRLDQRQRGGNRRYRPRSSLLGSQRKICDQNRADAWKRAIVPPSLCFCGRVAACSHGQSRRAEEAYSCHPAGSARRSTPGHNDPTEVLDWNEISWKVFHCR